MLTDEQFDDRLRSQLASEVAHVHADPDLLGALNRRHARRVAFTRAAFAVPVAAAVVATGAVVVAGAGGQRVPATGTSVAASGQVQMRDVAYVTAHIETALASPYVMRARGVYSDGSHTVSVLDTKTDSSRADTFGPNGLVRSSAFSKSGTSGWTSSLVDYMSRRYRRNHVSGKPVYFDVVLWDPGQLRAVVASGNLEILGTERLGGRDLLHLRAITPESTPGTPQPLPSPGKLFEPVVPLSASELSESWLLSGHRDIWVDARTYLPYRVTISGQPDNLPDETVTYEWLPRTDSNLALLDLPIPAGFKPLVPQ